MNIEDPDEAIAAFYYFQLPSFSLDGVPVAVEWADPLDDLDDSLKAKAKSIFVANLPLDISNEELEKVRAVDC